MPGGEASVPHCRAFSYKHLRVASPDASESAVAPE